MDSTSTGTTKALLLFRPLFLILSCLPTLAMAQLSGSYTIGGTGASYSKISDATAALASKGISGPVVFTVAAGTYSDNVKMSKITGSSSSNTIVFNGAGRGKSIVSAAVTTKPALNLNSCSYISFNGFTIQNTTSSGYVVEEYGTSNCAILNSNIKAVTGSSGAYAIYSFNTNYLTVYNCYLGGGNIGMYFDGSAGSSTSPNGNLAFVKNRITGFSSVGLQVFNSGSYASYGNYYSDNVVDSSSATTGEGFYSEGECGATYANNKLFATLNYGFYINIPNASSSAKAFQIFNNFFSKYQYYGLLYQNSGNGTKILVAHNTFYTDSTITPYAAIEANNSTAKGMSIESNLIEQLASNTASTSALLVLGGSASDYATIDGNDFYGPGQPTAYLYTAYATDFASYQKAMKLHGWEANANNLKPVFLKPPENLDLNQAVLAPTGVYAGINYDIDSNLRCKAFPTAGASESFYQKGTLTVKFYLPPTIYPGSPTTVTQTAKAGEPKLNHWYLNGVHISDSALLVTSKFVTGPNTLKLVTTGCTNKDSFQETDTVKAPTAVPGVDFLSNYNQIKTGDVVSFTDISTNGPTKWGWTITPSTATVNGNLVSTYQYLYEDSTSPDPQIQFLVGGRYKVCLAASNGIGAGSRNCRANYITVVANVNLGSETVAHDSAGILYDDGGPNAPYTNGGGTHSLLIDPCADTVYLSFTMFDVYCGSGSVQLYQGKNNGGKLLGSCSAGFTGGKTHTCAASCVPNTTKPDTFKAQGSMFVQMNDGTNTNAAGFVANWWSKPKKGVKPSPSFVTSGSGDSVCANHYLTFTNTTKTDPTDPPIFLWDLDGDLSTFECVGTCANAIQPYFLPGKVKTTLIATSCGGADTVSRTITVYNPGTININLLADNTNPTTVDDVFFSPVTSTCIDQYKWTFTRSGTTDTSSLVYDQGTSSSSASPVVVFADTGYYDVSLYVNNASAKHQTSVTKTKYIHVRLPYCTPAVSHILSDIGISHVIFNTINNYTKQAANDYTDFANTQSLATTVQKGLNYTLTVARDSPAFNAMVRTVYIDWNQDGNFSTAEVVATDSNTTVARLIKQITIPRTAKTGATIMRIATDESNYGNSPCGPNTFGEYQDYRIYVEPYNTLPVVTLSGKDTMLLELGYPFVEPGYTATSLLYGNLTSQVAVSKTNFAKPVPGGAIYTYSVVDSSGLRSLPVQRVVYYEKDTVPPQLEITGNDTVRLEVFTNITVPKIFFAYDLVTINPIITIDSSQVNNQVLGIYPVTYTATDSAGNKTVVVHYIDVVDTIKPVLSLIGKAIDTIAVNTSFTDPGVNISAGYYRNGLLDSLVMLSASLNVLQPGIDTIVYSLTDPSGNVAKPIIRIVVVIDTVRPVLSLVGPAIDSVEVNTNYTDPGVTVNDNVKPVRVTVARSGSFYATFPTGAANKPGTYKIEYTGTDQSGNKDSVSRTVKVKDMQAPVITLTGQPTATVCRWAKYSDAGYTVSDNYDSARYITIDTIGSFVTKGGTERDGIYNLAYVAIDRAGNRDTSAYRSIEVIAAGDAPCLSGVAPGLPLDQYISVFPNPATGVFYISANLPEQRPVAIAVTDIYGKQILQIENGALGSNNIKIDLGDKAPGVYLLRIAADGQTTTKRLEIVK